MDLYSATVNLNAKNTTQVHLSNLTATEIALLQAIHNDPNNESVGGFDPVIDIKLTGEIDRTDDEERLRLTGEGADGLGVPKYRMDLYRKAFPFDHLPLPQSAPGFAREASQPKARVPAKKAAPESDDVLD